MDAKQTYGENAWRHLQKNGASNIENTRRQHSTNQQLYGHQPPITKTIQIRRTRHAGHCWRSRDELIIDILLWTPSYERAKAGRPTRTYLQQLCADTGWIPEDQPEAMDDKEGWRGISVLIVRHDNDNDDSVPTLTFTRSAPLHELKWPSTLFKRSRLEM